MAKVIIPPAVPVPIAESRFARNGDMPSQSSLRRVAKGYNHIAGHQRKLIFAAANDTQSTPVMPSTNHSTFCTLFRTGENVESIAMMVGLAPASATSGTNQAYVSAQIYDGSTTINGPELHYHMVQSGIYPPTDVAWVWGEITAADGLLPNTEYRLVLNQYHYARVHSIMIYETALSAMLTTVAGVADPLAYESTKPIYDAGIQDLAETGTMLWRHNASQLLSFSQKSSTLADESTPNSTTWENVLSSGDSVWSASAPGFHLATRYHDTVGGDIPVVLGVYATRASGTGSLEVQLVQNGSTLLTQTGIGTTMTPFNSSTHTIAAGTTPTKTDVMVRCSSASTEWRIHAICLWEYEA